MASGILGVALKVPSGRFPLLTARLIFSLQPSVGTSSHWILTFVFSSSFWMISLSAMFFLDRGCVLTIRR